MTLLALPELSTTQHVLARLRMLRAREFTFTDIQRAAIVAGASAAYAKVLAGNLRRAGDLKRVRRGVYELVSR